MMRPPGLKTQTQKQVSGNFPIICVDDLKI